MTIPEVSLSRRPTIEGRCGAGHARARHRSAFIIVPVVFLYPGGVAHVIRTFENRGQSNRAYVTRGPELKAAETTSSLRSVSMRDKFWCGALDEHACDFVLKKGVAQVNGFADRRSLRRL